MENITAVWFRYFDKYIPKLSLDLGCLDRIFHCPADKSVELGDEALLDIRYRVQWYPFISRSRQILDEVSDNF